MAFIWFIVAIIFLALWLNANLSKKQSNKSSFESGYRQGKKDLADIVHAELAKHSTTHPGVKKVIDKERKAYIEQQEDEVPIFAAELNISNETDFLQLQSTPEDVSLVEEAYVNKPAISVKTKQQIAERNLNVLLYTASFLIVAAAAAFIATGLPPVARLAGLWLVIIAFYGAGMVLHFKVPYLRQASTAFIGTGLALVPFAGIALSQLGGLSGGWAWFITSIIGIVSYLIAALRLKSEIVTYLTIAFALSLAASSIATFSGPFVLYFVALIITSLVLHVLARSNASWVPDIFKLPINQTSQLLTPVTLIGSLLAYDSMSIVSYQIVFWVATVYYLVLWFTEKRIVYESVVRGLASISLFISVLYVYHNSFTAMAVYIVGLAAVQSTYSLLRVRLAEKLSRLIETSWLSVTIGLLTITLPLWTNTDVTQLGIIIQTSLIFVISIGASYRFRNVYFAVPALIASILLPFIVGRWPSNELWSMQVITWQFIVVSSLCLGVSLLVRGRSIAVRRFIQASFWVYISMALLVSFTQFSLLAFIVSTIGLAVVLFGASYIYKQWWIEIISLVLVIPIVTLTFSRSALPLEWLNVMAVGFTAMIYALVLLSHHLFGQTHRRNFATIAAVIVGSGLIFSYGQPNSVAQVAFFLALFYVVLGLLLRSLVASVMLRSLFTITYAVYPLLLILLASSLGLGWVALALAVTSATYWVASYVEHNPTITVFGNIAFVTLVATLWSWLGFDSKWYVFGVVWTTATIFYVASLVQTIFDFNSKRRYIHLLFTWILLGIVTVFNIAVDGSYGYAAAGSLLGLAVTIIVEGIVTNRLGLIELAIYISTLALQRLVGLSVPDVSIVIYAHWWAIIIFVVALWRKNTSYVLRIVIAMGFVTASTGVMALQDGGAYQLLFLIEHVALLVAGALSRTSWALWWGLVATILAVVYFLRSSLFLSLLFLGLTLLAIVIWRLVRANKK